MSTDLLKSHPRFPNSFAPNPIYSILNDLRSKGISIIDLTESNPTQLGLDYPKEIIAAQFLNEYSWTYQPEPRGLVLARKALVDYYKKREGIQDISPKDFFLTSGTSEAYSFLLKTFTRPGDEVILPIPCYPLLEELARLELCQVRKIHLEEDWEMQLSTKTRMLFLVSPNNPSGRFLKKEDYSKILEVARKHRLTLVIDEVFCEYVLDPNMEPRVLPYSHLPNFLRQENSIDIFVLNGISKMAGLPGWKLGWIFHYAQSSFQDDIQNRLEWIADTFLTVHSISQELLPIILSSRYLLQNQLKKRIQRNLYTLKEIKEPQGFQIEYGGAGWYASIKMSELQTNALDCCLHWLKEKQVLVYPGSFFGYDDERWIVSLILPEEKFKEGIEKLVL